MSGSPRTVDGLGALLAARAGQRPGGTAFRHKSRGLWHGVTWRVYEERVADLALGLRAAGVEPGTLVPLVADVSPDWVFLLAALTCAGARPLCLYQGLGMEEVDHVFGAHEPRLLAVDGLDWTGVARERGVRLPRRLLLMSAESTAGWEDVEIVRLSEVARAGAERRRENPRAWPDLRAERPAEDQEVLFCSPATGGAPRVVSHSIASLAHASQALVDSPSPGRPLGPKDSTVVELPTGHPGAVQVAIMLPLLCGLTAHLPEEVVAEAVADVRPTFSVSLGRPWEVRSARIRVAVLETRGFKGLLFGAAQAVRMHAQERAAKGRRPGPLPALGASLAFPTVFLPLISKFGLERLRQALVIGPVAPDLVDLWRAWGVRLQPVYGITEAGALAARQAGDVAEASGRASLAAIDAALRFSPFIRAAATLAPATGELVALLDLDFESITRWASVVGISFRTPAALRESEEVMRMIADEVRAVNVRLAGRGLPTVAAFGTSDRPFVVGRELSPTWSVRRSRIPVPEGTRAPATLAGASATKEERG